MPQHHRAQLERMLESRLFVVRPRMAAILRFFVEESLRNGGEAINQRLIATHALGLPSDFRPTKSAYVRTHVTRLRQALDDYYASVGRDDPIIFSITPGPYRLVVAEARPADETRADATLADTRLEKPTLVVIEPDDERCLSRQKGLGREVASQLMVRLVDSPFVRASGPLLRSRLAEDMLTGQVAAARWGYEYLCDATLSPADDEGIDCKANVTSVPNVRQILDESTTIRRREGATLAESVANWLFHRISEVFMQLRIDSGSAVVQVDGEIGATSRGRAS